MKKTIKNYRDKVERKLIIRQSIFLVIISVLLMISITNVLEEKIETTLAISGFLIATVLGVFASRMFKLSWHAEREKVVSQLDMMGIILLVGYIGVEMGRKWIFEYWLSGAELNAFGLVVLTGLLLGRFLGTNRQINDILSENKVAQ